MKWNNVFRHILLYFGMVFSFYHINKRTIYSFFIDLFVFCFIFLVRKISSYICDFFCQCILICVHVCPPAPLSRINGAGEHELAERVAEVVMNVWWNISGVSIRDKKNSNKRMKDEHKMCVFTELVLYLSTQKEWNT